MGKKDAIKALRDALAHSPDNFPLKKHLAELLLESGRFDDAEKEFKEALALAPGDGEVQFGLARAFHLAGKTSQALVVLEEAVKKPDAPASVSLLLAQILLHEGEVERGVHAYKQAKEKDPDISDPALEERFHFGADKADESVFEGRMRLTDQEAEEFEPDIQLERPSLDFDDVGGMDQLKEAIRMKIIHPLEHPEIYKAYNKPIGGGILLYGPPGCGKTYLARATAGEVRAGFLSVGLNDVLDMWIGNSERNLHQLFEYARDNRPCVLFFDEVDALGAKRSDMRQSGARHLINQFLSELDGVDASNEGVLILAATNAPWHLDTAFRRPGRFDRILFVPPPDALAREAILEVMLREKPVRSIDYGLIAKKTEGFSGADLKGLIDLAVEDKLQIAMKKGVPEPIETKDLRKALKSVKTTSREWFATAKNHALYSNQGGIYDDILDYLKLR